MFVKSPGRLIARTSALAGALAVALAAGPALADVDPPVVDRSANPGSSFTVDKVVHTPAIPPRPDIVLAVDTTGSMGGAIADVRTNLSEIVADVRASQPTAQFAVVSYRDEGDGAELFTVRTPLTDVEADIQAGVDSLAAGGGGDLPEAWINALWQISTGAITYRVDSSRIVVLVGDAPSHDPSAGHSLADATAELLADEARVVAVDVSGLDSDGQATAVTTDTGGSLVSVGSGADAVTAAILAGLHDLDVTVTPEVVACDTGLSLTFDHGAVTIPSGTDATYVETVNVAADATQGATLHCTVRFLLNGTDAGAGFVQTINVTVNDVTPPTVDCVLGPNPDGVIVPAPEAGFRTLVATDNVGVVGIYVHDNASTAVFGPYAPGTNVKLIQAPGATPSAKPGEGVVDWNIKLKGDAIIEAVDAAGNRTSITCLVPPPPK